MEDREIIALYHARNEQAITESDRKYGALCCHIAQNILSIREDAEECVNDTWQAAWMRMPPDRPQYLGAFFGRIARNISIDRLRASRARKRGGGADILLSELEECIPNPGGVEETVDAHRLAQIISDWLESLPQVDCDLFVRRYWYGDAVKQLAAAFGFTPAQLSRRMFRLRAELKDVLTREGVQLE